MIFHDDNDHSAQTAAVPDMPENPQCLCPATGRADAHFLPSHPASWAHSTGYPPPMSVAEELVSLEHLIYPVRF